MGKLSICAIVAGLLTASTASADVQVLLDNGRVSIVAKDATVRQILSEWARVGQTKIVNVERIPGGPLTLELRNVPEGQALDVLLRSVSGYMAAPRQTAVANLSVFDRIIVMPTAAAPRAAASAQPAPAFQQPQFQQPVAPLDDDADDPPANVQVPNQPRGPVFNAFPPPQVGGQNQPVGVPGNPGAQPAAPVTFGGAPSAPAGGGVSVPGMMTQPQQQQPQQWQPGMPTRIPPGTPTSQPGQTARPGGRGGGQQ
jgi:hypothetical protein